MKERDLKEMTLDRMIKIGCIEFYQRDIDEASIHESSNYVNTEEMLLQEEQDVSNDIQKLIKFGLKKYFNREDKVRLIRFSGKGYTKVELENGDKVGIDDKIMLKILKGYLRNICRDAEVLKMYTTKLFENVELLYVTKDRFVSERYFKYQGYNLFTCICRLITQTARLGY